MSHHDRAVSLFDRADAGARRPRRSRPDFRTGLSLVAAAAVLAIAACADQDPVAPELGPELSEHAAAHHIPGQFIVTLRPGADPRSVAAEHGVEPRYVYTTVLNGFAGKMSDAARAGLLRDTGSPASSATGGSIPPGSPTQAPPWSRSVFRRMPPGASTASTRSISPSTASTTTTGRATA